MGWKTALMIVGTEDCPQGYLATLPPHNPTLADEFISVLGYPEFTRRHRSSLDLIPGETVIGAYEKARIIVDPAIYHWFGYRYGILEKALEAYPSGTILTIVLHSGVNLFGYTMYEKGRLIREYRGDIDHGVTSEVGEPLPEERSDFERSDVIDGKRVFYSEGGNRHNAPPTNPRTLAPLKQKYHRFSPEAYGETLAFKVASRFFGQNLSRPTLSISYSDLDAEVFS